MSPARRVERPVAALIGGAVVSWPAAAWADYFGRGAPADVPASPLPEALRTAAGWVLRMQETLHQALAGEIAALHGASPLLPALAIVGAAFLYGVFHAVGPGHGKVVVAGHFAGRDARPGAGLALGVAIAAVQSLVAIAVVGIPALVLGRASFGGSDDLAILELASFALIAALGAAMLRHAIAGRHACGHTHHDHHGPGDARRPWPIAVAAGLRPCTGAILVLLFTLAEGVFAIGVVAALAMGLGTALTVGLIGMGVIGARRSILALAGRHRRAAVAIDAVLTYGAPTAILAFGTVMTAAMLVRFAA